MYTKGDRLLFIWQKPWYGVTPGTIKWIGSRFVVVKWDDGTKTKTSFSFLKNNTKKIKSH